MEWSITADDLATRDATGVEGLIVRMEQELRGAGPPIEGFRFLNSPKEMLEFSREIETEVLGSPTVADLYVGFQNVDKLQGESRRYRELKQAGVRLATYGAGSLPETLTDLKDTWTLLGENNHALENQWFLVSSSPSPIAFIGWEVSPRSVFGTGRLSAPGKEFKGFVTDDRRIVHAVIAHLQSVRAGTASASEPPHAGRIMAITSIDDSPEYAVLRSRAADLAEEGGGEVVLFELSAASYLVSPYPEENRRKWIRVLGEREMFIFGRASLAQQLETLRSRGVGAGVILPTTHGFRHLAEWVERENISMILLPASMTNPTLIDRLRGYSLSALLEHTGRPVMLVEPDGTMHRARVPQVAEVAA